MRSVYVQHTFFTAFLDSNRMRKLLNRYLRSCQLIVSKTFLGNFFGSRLR